MFRLSVTSRCATVMVAALAGWAAQAVNAEIAVDRAPEDGTVFSAPYTLEESRALLNVLESPGPSQPADTAFEAWPVPNREDVSMSWIAPGFAQPELLEPEGKRFDAWDIKGGTIVPEPATALLLGAGIAALAVIRGLRGRRGAE